jgi:hypothetical protein
MDGPEPGKSAVREVANRAFRTKEKEDLALGQGTAGTRNPRPDTYMQPLLGHAAKEGDLWHRRGKPEGKQQEHISIAMQNQPVKNKLTPFYIWMREHDIQYITELADWSSGFRGPRPLMPWVQCSKKIRQEMENQIELATAGLISEWKMPITKGHVILLKGGEYGESTFFEVDGFVTHDAPHMLAGVKYRPREQQPARGPGWRRGKRDEYTGVIIDPIEGTDIHEGSVRSGRCSLEHLLQHATGLAIGQVVESGRPIQLEGVKHTIPLDAEAQAKPRLHLSTTPP